MYGTPTAHTTASTSDKAAVASPASSRLADRNVLFAGSVGGPCLWTIRTLSPRPRKPLGKQTANGSKSSNCDSLWHLLIGLYSAKHVKISTTRRALVMI